MCWNVCWCVGAFGALEALETLEALVAKAVKVGNQANDGRQASQGRYDGLFLYQNENVLVCRGKKQWKDQGKEGMIVSFCSEIKTFLSVWSVGALEAYVDKVGNH